MINVDAEGMASTSWNGRKLWLNSQIGIMRINALARTATIPLLGVDFWHIFETQGCDRKRAHRDNSCIAYRHSHIPLRPVSGEQRAGGCYTNNDRSDPCCVLRLAGTDTKLRIHL